MRTRIFAMLSPILAAGIICGAVYAVFKFGFVAAVEMLIGGE